MALCGQETTSHHWEEAISRTPHKREAIHCARRNNEALLPYEFSFSRTSTQKKIDRGSPSHKEDPGVKNKDGLHCCSDSGLSLCACCWLSSPSTPRPKALSCGSHSETGWECMCVCVQVNTVHYPPRLILGADCREDEDDLTHVMSFRRPRSSAVLLHLP